MRTHSRPKAATTTPPDARSDSSSKTAFPQPWVECVSADSQAPRPQYGFIRRRRPRSGFCPWRGMIRVFARVRYSTSSAEMIFEFAGKTLNRGTPSDRPARLNASQVNGLLFDRRAAFILRSTVGR